MMKVDDSGKQSDEDSTFVQYDTASLGSQNFEGTLLKVLGATVSYNGSARSRFIMLLIYL
jgi:hypothetical protein